MIEFEAIPNSFRQLKISEDGGGSRITLDFVEVHYKDAYALSLLAGKRVKFTAELIHE